MFALILSICMAPIDVQGNTIGPDVCEQSVMAEHKTLKQCTNNMEKQIKAIKNSVLAPFDWMVSCEALQPSQALEAKVKE